jgi:GTP-binding protein
VLVKAGPGGPGRRSFARLIYKPVAAPDGGNGGRGGSVYIELDRGLRDLRSMASSYNGSAGAGGDKNYCLGANGEDVVIKVPFGTIIEEQLPVHVPKSWEHWAVKTCPSLGHLKDILFSGQSDGASGDVGNTAGSQSLEDLGYEKLLVPPDFVLPHPKLYLDLSHAQIPNRTRILVARGGDYGLGNCAFASSTNRGPTETTLGKEGQLRYLKMELKITADVGLVGFPNAGKSTFLRSVTKSRTRTGDYEFTTLGVHIGTATVISKLKAVPNAKDLGDHVSMSEAVEHRLTIADIPGIIKDAHANRGLGHEFLRHIERTKLLAIVLDLSQENPVEDLEVLISELKQYRNGACAQKDMVILANKADVNEVARTLSESDAESESHAKVNYAKLTRYVRDRYMESGTKSDLKIKAVIPISAKHRRNVSKALDVFQSIIEEQQRQELASVESGQIPSWNSPTFIQNGIICR